MPGASRHKILWVTVGAIAILLAMLWFRIALHRASPASPVESVSEALPNRGPTRVPGESPDDLRVPIEPEIPSASEPSSTSNGTGPGLGSYTAQLLDEEGAPIQGTWVIVVDAVGRRQKAESEAGEFALRGLSLGAYSAIGYSVGRKMITDSFELTPEAPDVRHELRLPRLAMCYVDVLTPDGRRFIDARRDSGAPDFLHEITPIATRTPPGPRFAAMRGGGSDPIAIGEFRWCSESEWEEHPTRMGTIYLHAEFPAYVSLVLGQSVLGTKRVDHAEEEITFQLSLENAASFLASVHVRVLDGITSRPVERARVSLRCGRRGTVDAETNASGEASLAPVLPGRFALLVVKDGYPNSLQDLDLQPSQAADVTVRLSQPVGVEVRVYSPDGAPCAARLRVMQLRTVSGKYRTQWLDVVKSEADGRLLIANLEPGIYLLADQAAGMRDAGMTDEQRPESVPPNVVVDTTSGFAAPIDVHLSKAVTLLLRPPAGDPADLEFEIVDARELPVCAERFDLPWPRRFHLAPGAYRVRFTDSAGTILEEKKVTLTANSVDLTYGK